MSAGMRQAAQAGDAAEVGRLLAAGEHPDAAKGGNSETALMQASMHGHEECVKRLVAGGADLDLQDQAPQTCWPGGTGYSALHHAALNGHVGVCRVLVGAGASVELPTNGGSWHDDEIQDAGPSDDPSRAHSTALELAEANEQTEVVAYLEAFAAAEAEKKAALLPDSPLVAEAEKAASLYENVRQLREIFGDSSDDLDLSDGV
jgi:ankyrin repeat protein